MQKKRRLSQSREYPMTLPDERYRAVMQTQKFLLEILSTPRIPKKIKDGAKHCLRHYPSEYDMKKVSRTSSDVFVERMEPLTRMMEVYKIEQKEESNDN